MGNWELDFWNKEADKYQKTVGSEDEDEYPQRLEHYLAGKGALQPGRCVADIGCGAGKYAIRFAKRGCDLILTDLSPRMLQYAAKNLSGFSVKRSVTEGDFSIIDVRREGWIKKCGLAFANMSPAVRDKETLEKMCQISKKHCFVSKFSSVRNSLGENVFQAFGIPGQQKKFREYEEVLRAVRELGYFPELTLVKYTWRNRCSVDEAVQQSLKLLGESGFARGVLEESQGMRRSLDLLGKNSEKKEEKVREILQSLADCSGIIQEQVTAEAAWIYWQVD